MRVPDGLVPADLAQTARLSQHFVTSAARARELLDWRDSDPRANLRRTVEWHLAHPPEASADFSEDDAALAGASAS